MRAVIDLELVGRDDGGRAVKLALSDIHEDLSAFDGADSAILDADDLAQIAGSLEPGHVALALVYEDRALAAAATQWAGAGGTELYSGGIAIDDLAHVTGERTD